jgi:RNase P/RNase MRP subunit POP5
MKQIPPAIQEKEHYLKFRVRGDKKEFGEVVDSIWKSVNCFLGTKGSSQANVWVIENKFDEAEQEGVIGVQRDMVDEVRAALTLNPGFEDETFLSVEKVSGNLSGLSD